MAVVYSREIDGNIITLTPSGWTYGEDAFNSVFVLMDKETESLWFPAGQEVCTLPPENIKDASCGLVGISGSYTDTTLTGQTQSMTIWSEWKQLFPDTKFVTD
ncbi:hypothetical protein ACFLXH_01120 [Chloroflexota bacterium]